VVNKRRDNCLSQFRPRGTADQWKQNVIWLINIFGGNHIEDLTVLEEQQTDQHKGSTNKKNNESGQVPTEKKRLGRPAKNKTDATQATSSEQPTTLDIVVSD
jgi:hypothetical protein